MPNREKPVDDFNVKYIHFLNGTSGSITDVQLSGSLYISGGALCYKSAAGTVTVVGAA